MAILVPLTGTSAGVGNSMLRAAQLAAEERLRRQFPLPAGLGAVDTVSSLQALLLANGVAYRPRP